MKSRIRVPCIFNFIFLLLQSIRPVLGLSFRILLDEPRRLQRMENRLVSDRSTDTSMRAESASPDKHFYLVFFFGCSRRFKNFPVKDKDLFLVFCGIGVVGPGVFLLAALVTHHTEGSHLKPHFGENTCWFGGRLSFFIYPSTSYSIVLLIKKEKIQDPKRHGRSFTDP